jgi:alkanesulfonate monooxygenase SsuD/methylene tetrahydromethanopterin reductase-like flavin-dependent oxidoreductase (luciferase family)
MEVDIAIATESSSRDLVAAAVIAEAYGFGRIWLTDVRLSRDPYAVLGAISAGTGTIGLAIGVSDPYSRHPANLAASAATLNELAPGRVAIGLGAGGLTLKSFGLKSVDSVATVEAALDSIRGLLNGRRETVATAGFSLSDAVLGFSIDQPIPLALVAHGPLMYRLAGRKADIVILANYVTSEGIKWARDQVAAGLAEREVSLGAPRELWRIDVCLNSTDDHTAREVMRRKIELYLRVGYFGSRFLQPLGLDRLIDRPQRDDMIDLLVDSVALVGRPSDVASRMRSVAEEMQLDYVCLRVHPLPGQSLPEAVESAGLLVERILGAR